MYRLCLRILCSRRGSGFLSLASLSKHVHCSLSALFSVHGMLLCPVFSQILGLGCSCSDVKIRRKLQARLLHFPPAALALPSWVSAVSSSSLIRSNTDSTKERLPPCESLTMSADNLPKNAESKVNPIKIISGKYKRSIPTINSGSRKKSPSPTVVVDM